MLAVLVGTAAAQPMVPTMNAFHYTIANPLDPKAPGSISYRGEYFEMLGPATTSSYSEVYWQPQPVELPQHIVDRFDNRVMAVTGYEVDLVRTDGHNNSVPAPCFELYNHHWTGWMRGKHASPTSQAGSDDNPIVEAAPPMAHGQPIPTWHVRDTPGVIRGIPSVQGFSEGNGNEHRGSYRGYARGYAQLIQSPREWSNNPMIINTNKRLTADTSPGHINHKLVPPGVLSPSDSKYSGLLECPCTTRKVKVVDWYEHLAHGQCAAGHLIHTPSECDASARASGLPATANASRIHDTATYPPGCTATPTADGWLLRYNTARQSSVPCGPAAGHAPSPSTAHAVGFGAHAKLGVNFSLSLDAASTRATITMTGPADVWFALAFNASVMADAPYAIVVDATGVVTERRLSKHAPGQPIPTSVTVAKHTVVSGVRTLTVTRSLTGASVEHFSFNASASSLPMLLAHGTSGAGSLGYHAANRAALTLTLAQANSSMCVCRDPNANSGTIDGLRFNAGVCAAYPKSELLTTHNAICNISQYGGGLYCCHGGTILLDDDQDVPESTDTWRLKYRFYFEEYNHSHGASGATSGGGDLSRGGATHAANAFRLWWSTEATNNEYDVPKSPADCLDPLTPEAACTHTLVSKFTGRDMLVGSSACMVSGDPAACGNATRIARVDGGFYQLIYAAGHCHAPACKSLELWDLDRKELLCRNVAVFGKGVQAHYDEEAYLIAIPPCVWGSAAEGLRPPPRIHLSSNLSTVKRANSTNGHWGVMGLWQMRGTYLQR